MKIALISCCKQKREELCMAKDIYISPLFKYSLKYIIQHNYDKYYILSAKYGLLQPDIYIEPYDNSLISMPKNDRVRWGISVSNDIYRLIKEGSTIDIYGGKLYYCNLDLSAYDVNIIFGNMGIGQRLKYLKNNIDGE